MPNYKEMYLTLFRAAENAIRVLSEGQAAAEELLLREKPEDGEEGGE